MKKIIIIIIFTIIFGGWTVNFEQTKLEKETKTAGGLILSTSAAEQPAQGEIIAVGNGKITDNGVRALDVKVGDNVLFGAYAGTKVKVEGEELLVMKESDILAVLEG